MKTTRHSLMAKGILVLLSLLIMVFIFTYSWYVDVEKPLTATGLVIDTRDATTDFEYAIGFSNSQTGNDYKHTAFTNQVNQDLNLEELYAWDDTNKENPINLLYDYNPTDITGDGVTLVRPAMTYGNWSINTASGNYSIATPNEQYISFDLIFRTEVRNTTIRLDQYSCARADCETYAGDGSLTGAANNSDGSALNYNELTIPNNVTSNKYGRFSRDAIVGAVRVAFLEYTDNDQDGLAVLDDEEFQTFESTPKLLWLPRPDIYLNNGGQDGETTGWSLNQNVASGTTFNLVSKAQNLNGYTTYRHQYYNIFEPLGQGVNPSIVYYDTGARASTFKASVLNTSAGSGVDKVTFGTQADIVTLNHLDDANNNGVWDEGEYYYGKVRVRIWLEGTDSESRRACAGGKFSVSFHITG